jgi:hypothetical protein
VAEWEYAGPMCLVCLGLKGPFEGSIPSLVMTERERGVNHTLRYTNSEIGVPSDRMGIGRPE